MRSCVDRLAEDGNTTISKVMAQIQASGTHEIRFRDAQGQAHRALLERATRDRKRDGPRDLDFYVRAIARLRGYLDRAADPPPGTTVIWRGFSRLADLIEGARIATNPGICG